MIVFSQKEKEFLNSLEECRISTTQNNVPHIKPVCFIFKDDQFFIATDYDTKAYKNLKENSLIAISIDIYKPGAHKAVLIQGRIEIIENGAEFLDIYKRFYEKFQWVRNEPWKENEAPFIKITPNHKISWGL